MVAAQFVTEKHRRGDRSPSFGVGLEMADPMALGWLKDSPDPLPSYRPQSARGASELAPYRVRFSAAIDTLQGQVVAFHPQMRMFPNASSPARNTSA